MGHIHSVYDTDKHFSVEPSTRALVNQTPEKACIMQYDHDSERITFDLPAVIEGHDILTCNRVEVHYLNIDAQTKEQRRGLYTVDDLQASPESDDVAICSWLISMSATQLVGPLYFRLTFKCVTEGAIDYSWSTAIYKGLSVSDGINNTEYVVEKYVDTLERWLQEFDPAPDWNQNAPSAVGYIKHRTHWVEIGNAVFVQDATETFSDRNFMAVGFDIELAAGRTYEVIWDDKTYSCVAYLLEAGGESATVLGNVSIINPAFSGGNNEPFVLTTMEVVLMAADVPGTHTFTISGEKEIIHGLDPKYIDLTSPNGTKFILKVDDDGYLYAYNPNSGPV